MWYAAGMGVSSGLSESPEGVDPPGCADASSAAMKQKAIAA
jgi:hypothetical protein